MLVMILPVNDDPNAAGVHVNGTHVGNIRPVTPTTPWTGFDGQTHIGQRWMPEGVDPSIEGPATQSEAALLLIALHDESIDRAAAAKALRLVA